MRKVTTHQGKLLRIAQAIATPRTVVSEEWYGEIRRMHRAGKTLYDIADHFGVNPTTLGKHCRTKMSLHLNAGVKRAHEGDDTTLTHTNVDFREFKALSVAEANLEKEKIRKGLVSKQMERQAKREKALADREKKYQAAQAKRWSNRLQRFVKSTGLGKELERLRELDEFKRRWNSKRR